MPKRKRPWQKWLKPVSELILDFGLAKGKSVVEFRGGHDDQTDKDPPLNRAGEAATSAGCAEGRASANIRCRRNHVEADVARLCPRVDRRPKPCLAA